MGNSCSKNGSYPVNPVHPVQLQSDRVQASRPSRPKSHQCVGGREHLRWSRILWVRGRFQRRSFNNKRNLKFMNIRNLSMISVRPRKSSCFSICALGAICVFACVESGRAQGTISASATLAETGTAGSEFEYSLTIDNTGTVPINAVWYGWVQGSFDLPSVPTTFGAPTGWNSIGDGDSIQFENSTGSAIAPGAFGTFTFESTSTLSAMTTGTTDGAPTGSSVAYANDNGPSTFGENQPGVSSGPFQPTAVPEPSTLGLLATGLASMSAWLGRRRSKA
jgi:hypothetical protein